MDTGRNYPFADAFPFGDRQQNTPGSPGGGSTQFARPISDIGISGYSPSSGTSCFAMLDEIAANDTDYIVSVSGAPLAVMQMTALSDPGFDTNHTLSVRAADIALGLQNLSCDLHCGATLIETIAVPANLTPTTVGTVLSPSNVANINNYSDLRVTIRDEVASVKDAERRIYWIELKVGI